MKVYFGKVDELFSIYPEDRKPGAAIAVCRDGEVIFSKGYGLANIELDSPITPKTVFNIGSESKQFTAMAILMLEAEEKLSLEDEVKEHLPGFPDFGHPVRIRHLMHHTSGLRDSMPLLLLAGIVEGDVTEHAETIRLAMKQRELNFPPGSEYDYSNTGYLFLAEIVKEISGQDLKDFCHERIFEPLGMKSTVIQDYSRDVIRNRALSYYYDEEKAEFLRALLSDGVIGSTNIWTTVEDLALWDENFYTGKVGGEALIAKMLEPGKLNDGKQQRYAAGLITGGSYRGLPVIEHGGGQGGFVASLIRFPEQHFSVILLLNQFGWGTRDTALEVADIFLEDEFAPAAVGGAGEKQAVEKADLKDVDVKNFTGRYFNQERVSLREVILKGEVLSLVGMNFIAKGDNSFMLDSAPGVTVSFTGNAGSLRTECWIDNGESKTCYSRIDDWEVDVDGLGAYTGLFMSPELDAYWRIELVEGQLQMVRTRFAPTPLSPLFKDVFEDDWAAFDSWPNKGTVIFTRDDSDDVNGFTLSTDRIRHLRFNKL